MGCQPPSKYWRFSSSIPSYLLKVTIVLGKISQFEFLVMTEKNIFAYKLFLSLNISDLNLFFMWQLQHPPPPLKNVTPPLSQQPPSKNWGPFKHPFLKIWLEAQTPCRKGRGAHYETQISNTRKRREICSKVTIKSRERRKWRRSIFSFFFLNSISHLFLVIQLLSLNK